MEQIYNIIFLLLGIGIGYGYNNLIKQAEQLKQKAQAIKKPKRIEPITFQSQDLILDRQQQANQRAEDNKLPHKIIKE